MKRVQFNVRIARDVADGLRGEAERRGIGPGELLEELATSYRAATRPGLWLELEPRLEAGLRAVAASRGLEPEALIQQLLGTSTRRLLQGLMDELPTLEPGSKHPVRGSTPSPPDPETQAHPAERVPDARSVRSADESSASLPHGERRRRPRRVALSDAERAELARVLDELPRTGQALRDWRLTRGIDSAALGLACGVSRVAVGLWEKKGDLPAPILLKLARGLASID